MEIQKIDSDTVWMAGHIAGIGDCIYEMARDKVTKSGDLMIRRVCRLMKIKLRDGSETVTPVKWGPIMLGALGIDQWLSINPTRIGPVGECSEAAIRVVKETLGIEQVEVAQEAALSILDAAREQARRNGQG